MLEIKKFQTYILHAASTDSHTTGFNSSLNSLKKGDCFMCTNVGGSEIDLCIADIMFDFMFMYLDTSEYLARNNIESVTQVDHIPKFDEPQDFHSLRFE